MSFSPVMSKPNFSLLSINEFNTSFLNKSIKFFFKKSYGAQIFECVCLAIA